MSLADELLADLEEDEEVVEENEQDAVEGLEEVDEQLPSMNAYDRIGSVAKLSSTQRYTYKKMSVNKQKYASFQLKIK